jgi:hypothetical protein
MNRLRGLRPVETEGDDDLAQQQSDQVIFSTAKIVAFVALLGFLATLIGTIWWASAQSTHVVEKLEQQDTKLASVQQQGTKDISDLRSTLVDRLDRTDNETARRAAEVNKRMEDDERETKAAAQFVATVDLRLTRIEAQLELIVKNITAGGATRK